MDTDVDMDMEQIVDDFGQLFLMALDGPRLADDAAEFFRSFRIGGVILFRDNFRDVGQLRSLIDELQRRCAPTAPLFIATDHEGGRVQRFRAGFTRIEAMAECGRLAPSEVLGRHRVIGRELRAVGVNFNLAPVADVCAPETPGAIGDRSFGPDAARVAECVCAAIAGLRHEGVLSCVKHFPGHGCTTQDSHDELPVVHAGRAELDGRDLVPFRAAIAADVEAIMTAHVLYPGAGDADWPASLSRHWITDVLRRQLGFDGLVVTDAIEMKALTSSWSPESCGRKALAAGSDVLLYYKEAHQFEAFHALRCALERGDIDPAPIAASLRRIARAKAGVIPPAGRDAGPAVASATGHPTVPAAPSARDPRRQARGAPVR
jgi:beta-N-acetylhexosaminidase